MTVGPSGLITGAAPPGMSLREPRCEVCGEVDAVMAQAILAAGVRGAPVANTHRSLLLCPTCREVEIALIRDVREQIAAQQAADAPRTPVEPKKERPQPNPFGEPNSNLVDT